MKDYVVTVETLPLRPLASASAQAAPPWAEVWQRLGMFSHLGRGWNGAAAVPLDGQTLRFAAQELAGLSSQHLPAPVVNPSPDGTLYAEWHLKGLDLEVVFERPYAVTILASDTQGEFDIEDEQDSLSEAARMLRRVMDR